jgi:alpha/beta superfamily hydrolase
LDLEAALEFLADRKLAPVWLVGWSFGTEIAIKYGFDKNIAGAILLSPPLHRASEADLANWIGSNKKLVAVVPELDEFLAPKEAAVRFAAAPEAQVIAVAGAKHLWVGESATKTVLNEIVKLAAPGSYPLPKHF